MACTLAGCATANNGGGLINGVFGSVGRLLQAVGRTAGLNAQVSEPPAIDAETGAPSNVAARGRFIECQGAYGVAASESRAEKMAAAR